MPRPQKSHGTFFAPPPSPFFLFFVDGGENKWRRIQDQPNWWGEGYPLGGGGTKRPEGSLDFSWRPFFSSRNNMWEMPCGVAGPSPSQFVVLLCPLLPLCFLEEEGEGSEKSTLVEKRERKGEEGNIFPPSWLGFFLLAREMTYIFIARLAPPPLHFLPSSAAELHFLVSHKKRWEMALFLLPTFFLSYPRSYLEL